MVRVRVQVLGGFGVVGAGGPASPGGWRHRRAAEVVKLLVLAPGHRLHREQLMDALWPDMAPEAAGANLRKAVHYARRALGSDDSIATDGEMVALFPGADVVVDLEQFERQAQLALLDVDPADEEAHQALMRAVLDAGNRSQVIAQFGRLRERLRVDLGVGPDARSIAIYEKALALGGTEPDDVAERVRAKLAWGLEARCRSAGTPA